MCPAKSMGLIFVLFIQIISHGEQIQPKAEEIPQPNAATFITDIFSFTDCLRPQIDLNGSWQFRRDPNNIGKIQLWHEGKDEFTDVVKVPGAPQAQGFGKPNYRQKTFFMEPFWVRRNFSLPKIEQGKKIWLRIGGILPAAEIYINGSYIGYTKSSRTQQRVDITNFIKAGKENLIAIKVCDFPKIRLDGLWEMAEAYKMWTGVYMPVACEITDDISVIDAYVQPKLAAKSVSVTVNLSQPCQSDVKASLQAMDGKQRIGKIEIIIPKGQTQAQAEVKLANFTTWAPEHPKLYTLNISLNKGKKSEPIDKVAIRFGMREIVTKGTKFYLNGSPIFMNCFGDDQLYPETLCPPADKEWYLSRLKRAQEYGMNASKSCVDALPQPYIEAADEAGIMIIQETPFGLSELRANRYTIDQNFRDYYTSEFEGLVRESRNHASIIAYSMSSEMEFSNQTQDSFDSFSKKLPQLSRQLAPHALVIDCTGYLNTEDTNKGKRITDFYASIHPKWMKEVLDETDFETDNLHPTILHEYNWWSNYPTPDDKGKYANTQLIPHWLDTLVKTAKENGQEELIPVYHKNSLWLQALCRKDGIEYTRRNPIIEGYILWLLIDLHQYSEGLLDDFWNPKNVSAEEFRKSNGPTVILLAKEGDRCLKMGNKVQIPIAVSHYGEDKYPNSILQWKVLRNDSVFQEGKLDIPNLTKGELTQIGAAQINLPNDAKAYKLEFQVALLNQGKTINTNNWSFWAFPEVRQTLRDITEPNNAGKTIEKGVFLRLRSAQSQPIPQDTSLIIADSVDPALADFIENGGHCLLFARGVEIENTVCYYQTTTFYTTFRTIPWNAGSSGNSGTVITAHPALAAFPNEGRCDLQFISMIPGVLPMDFSPLRQFGVTPIIRSIDHYLSNRNNAYMLEYNVGKGKVLVTTLGVLDRLDKLKSFWEQNKQTMTANKKIEVQYLLQCLVDYAQGSSFAPGASVPREDFLKLFSQRAASESPKSPDQLLK